METEVDNEVQHNYFVCAYTEMLIFAAWFSMP